MRALLISIMVAGAVFVPGACAKQAPKTAQIEVKLEYPVENWRPTSVKVATGGVVTWTNRSNSIHSVVSGEGLWPTQILAPGESFSYTYTKAGTYTYSDDPPTTVGFGTIYVE